MEDVRTVLGTVNVNSPKGELWNDQAPLHLNSTDQLFKASEYRPLIVAFRNGAAVRLSDVAQVLDSVEDVRTGGMADGKPAVLVIISRQPGANIIATADGVLAELPQLQAEIPAGMNLSVAMDRTTTIRASVREVEFTLSISLLLVVLVVFVFLRDWRTTLIPSVAVPVSLIGTFGVMYLAGYSIDNLSLMALTIATGFVVDDAIVVIEHITRHLEAGMKPMDAALLGAKEIGFTVVSMSTSLIAVFIPILLMTGLVGRLFPRIRRGSFRRHRHFIAGLAHHHADDVRQDAQGAAIPTRGRIYRFSEGMFNLLLGGYRRTLAIALRHPGVMILHHRPHLLAWRWCFTSANRRACSPSRIPAGSPGRSPPIRTPASSRWGN